MFHVFKNQLIITLRSKSLIFWTLLFPIILGTFFSLAFSNLYSDEIFEPIDIAVVNDENYNLQTDFKQIINDISSSEDKIFNVTLVDEEQAKELLSNNKVVGYYIVKDNIKIVVKTSGIDQTIMKYVVDNYYQTYSVAQNLYKYNPSNFSEELINNINTDKDLFVDTSNKNTDFTVIYFYTLIGMVCLYAGFFGINSVKETEANLTKRAARLSVAPTHKLKNLIATLLSGLLISFVELIILICYLVLILNVDFGNQIPAILLLGFVGCLAGISLGTFIGVSNKLGEGLKSGLLLATSMTCSFLSGMMMWQMKYIIANNVPILNAINPVSMITDALYSLYYFSDLTRYYSNIISLLVFSLIMIIMSYLFIRRKKYDSI